jgi:hypothetical protein
MCLLPLLCKLLFGSKEDSSSAHDKGSSNPVDIYGKSYTSASGDNKGSPRTQRNADVLEKVEVNIEKNGEETQ